MEPVDEVAEFISRQIRAYIDEFYSGDVQAFADDHNQSEESIKNYLKKKRKPAWEIMRVWFDKGMSPLWLFLDLGPKRWNKEDADIADARLKKLQGAQDALQVADRLLNEVIEFA